MSNKSTVEFSVVSPVYMGEKTVRNLVGRLRDTFQKWGHSYEIILVDDRSPDDAWAEMSRLSAVYPEVKSIRLSRNFGQHAAIYAGLEKSEGAFVVVMDCDLQDQPEEIPAMFEAMQLKAADLVLAQRINRQDGFFKRKGSQVFYSLFAWLTETEQDPEVANFGIYKRKVIESVMDLGDYIRFFPTHVKWVGFKRVKHPVKHANREEGSSSYSWKSLFRLASNVILSFSDKPLKLAVRLGLLVSFLAFAFGIFNLIQYFLGHIEVLGYTSLIVSIWFLSGLIIFVLGLTGLYVGKSFEQVRNRPVYIIDESINDD